MLSNTRFLAAKRPYARLSPIISQPVARVNTIARLEKDIEKYPDRNHGADIPSYRLSHHYYFAFNPDDGNNKHPKYTFSVDCEGPIIIMDKLRMIANRIPKDTESKHDLAVLRYTTAFKKKRQEVQEIARDNNIRSVWNGKIGTRSKHGYLTDADAAGPDWHEATDDDVIPVTNSAIANANQGRLSRKNRRHHVPEADSTKAPEEISQFQEQKFWAAIHGPSQAAVRARKNELTYQLNGGKTYIQIANMLQLTPRYIVNLARQLLGTDALKKKTGTWSNEEVEDLIELRKYEKARLSEMSLYLRRSKNDVLKKLREIFEQSSASELVQISPASTESDSRMCFTERMGTILEGLLASKMTTEWRQALESKPIQHWLDAIVTYIPDPVVQLLGRPVAPTWKELKELPPVLTQQCGVYARLVENRFEIQTSGDRYLYVGSATRYRYGLFARMRQHQYGFSRLQHEIKRRELNGDDRFIVLMAMESRSSQPEDIMEMRRIVVLAESIFTMWLGALSTGRYLNRGYYEKELLELYPWNYEMLDYTGWSSHNPLMDDLCQSFQDTQEES